MDPSTHVLADAKAAWRTHAMLRAMSADYLLREQFATDPMQIYCDYVASDRIAVQKVEAANQVIFSVFSSPQLRRWMGAYSQQLGGKTPSRHLFARQFAIAVAESRDPVVTLALVRSAATGEGHFELLADFFRIVLAALGRADLATSGTEMSPGVTATEMSPGAAGTEMSLALAGRIASEIASAAQIAGELGRPVLAAGTEMTPGATTTEMSPGPGTDMSPGFTDTEMSPGAPRLVQSLVAAIGRAERFSEQLVQVGTEMSPGTATEMSPGVTATEMSPGAGRISEQLVAEIRVAARLASSLLAAGGTEMSPGGGTEMSPGVTATEMSPGRSGSFEALTAALGRAEQFSVELLRAARGIGSYLGGTEMSPGRGTDKSPGGTEMSPGRGTDKSPGGTEMSPGRVAAEIASAAQFAGDLDLPALVAGTEMSPGKGTDKSPGGTDKSPGGTEMSPGKGTDKSPGGTEMSPGKAEVIPNAVSSGLWGAQLPPAVAIALGALAQFAVVLRRQGALDASGL